MGVESEGRAAGRRGWRRVLARRLPVTSWGARYGRAEAAGDAVAGLTLGLTLVPQSIAYAALADLPVHYGLYSSFVGPILYAFLGTVKEVSIGPTSLMALLTLQACRGLPPEYAVLLTMLAGCVVLLMGMLRLGFLVDLISPSVTSGFTSATAVIIVVSQLKGALGLSFTAESVPDNLRQLAAGISRARPADCVLALVSCSLLLLLRKLKDLKVGGVGVQRALWLASTGRNALVVLAGAVLAYCTHDPHHLLLQLSGRVEPGLPPLSLPWLPWLTNGTVGPVSTDDLVGTESFTGALRRLGPAVLLVPAVMVIANIAIAKAFSGGERVDATQEMLTLGLCNIVGSLVSAMPACGAFTRSCVAHASGVRSPAAGIYCGLITLLALIFLTPYFYFIPKACLSSVLICAVIFMIDVKIVRRLWRQDKGELAVLLLTFAVSVAASVELGVLAGALAAAIGALARLLRAAGAALRLDELQEPEAGRVLLPPLMVYVTAGRALAAAGERAARGRRPLLLDAGRLWLLDHAALQTLERLSAQFQSRGQPFVVYNAAPEAARLLQGSALDLRALAAPSPAAALQALQEPAGGHHAAPAEHREPTGGHKTAEIPLLAPADMP